jgi:hypothetical protein
MGKKNLTIIIVSILFTTFIAVINYGGCAGGSNSGSSGNNSSLIPAAPSSLIAGAISSTAINVSWTDNTTNETGFYLESKTVPSITYTVVATLTVNTTNYIHTGLTANTTYYYRVKTFNFLGQSSYSNEASTLTSWDTILDTTAPSQRKEATAVWADNIGMIVWGGWNDVGGYITTGGVYSPTGAVSWTAIAVPAIGGRIEHSAIWTGSEMLIWGGKIYDDINSKFIYYNDGGKYDPLSGWTTIASTVSPISLSAHAAIWTGDWMIISGGYNDTTKKTLAAFSPAVNDWVYYLPDLSTARRWHTSVWTGSGTESWRHQVIVWGGENTGPITAGEALDMETMLRHSLPITNQPSARFKHTSVWTGSKMIIWGGTDGITYLNTGGIYDLPTNSWQPISTINAPTGRVDHTAIWTGSKMIVWGGGGAAGFNDGGMYDPTTNTWTPLSTINSPTPRGTHVTAWTGTEMLIWGGWDGQSIFKTGGRYKIE